VPFGFRHKSYLRSARLGKNGRDPFLGEALGAKLFDAVESICARFGLGRPARAPILTGRFDLTPEQVGERFAVHPEQVGERFAVDPRG
jgi:hypothetical protein